MCVCVCVWCLISEEIILCKNIPHDRTNIYIYISYTREYIYFVRYIVRSIFYEVYDMISHMFISLPGYRAFYII